MRFSFGQAALSEQQGARSYFLERDARSSRSGARPLAVAPCQGFVDREPRRQRLAILGEQYAERVEDVLLAEDREPLAARLAVDEALARGDGERARARSTRARVALEEVAARALLLGQRGLAKKIASDEAAADINDLGAALVLAACEGGDLVGASRMLEARPAAPAPVSGATFVAFGAALVHAVSPGEVHRALARVAHRPLVAGDQRVAAGAGALAARGALDEAAVGAVREAGARRSHP